MPTTEEFLRAILPSSGLYCLTRIKAGAVRQTFHDTIKELAQSVTSTNDGWEVYHGCASYSRQGRAKDDVRVCRSLWLDLDDKDIADSFAALKAFVVALRLPPPLCVHSGHGLHAYWPLREELIRVDWEGWASALRGACQAQGLKADHVRTCDIASILRPPGTWNRKNEPVEVLCGPIVGPYGLEEFDGLLRFATAPQLVGSFSFGSLGARPDFIRSNTSPRLVEALSYEPDLEPIDFEQLISNCGQYKSFCERRGNMPEPLWYALLGGLAFAEGGSEKAHEWSAGHPKYSRAETDRKLERAGELSGPTTRSKIESLNPGPCVACVFQCRSTPLEAGRRSRQAIFESEGESQRGDKPVGGKLAVPKGFHVETNGPVWHIDKKEGEDLPVKTKVTAFAVHVKSVHVGELSVDQHHYMLTHWKPHAGWRDITLKAGDMASDSIVQKMADIGVLVHHKPLFVRYVRGSVEAIEAKRRAEVSYEQFGWKDGAFLYGSRLYRGSDTPILSSISSQLAQRAPWLAPVAGGSLGGWKQAVDNLFAGGSEGMSFTVLASFAAPLMRFLQENEGGAIISLVTRHSGAGKSTSLEGARSVWASDKRALDLVDIDTRVSKSVALGMLCNLPATFDEFQNKDPAVTAQLLITFTNGRDKNRATQDGKLTSLPMSWQTFLVAAGNQSLVDTIKAGGGTDAPAMRVLEFPVESSGNLKQSELMAIAEALKANSGHAGDAYLRFLTQPEVFDWVKGKLPEMIDEIFEKCHFQKEHRFWARALAAIGVASLIVNRLSLVSFSPERIMDWGMQHFSSLAGSDPSDKSMVRYLAAFLNERIDETLHMPCASKGRVQIPPIGEVPRRKICVRIEHDSYTCWIAERELRMWLEKNAGGGYGTLVSELKSLGLLVTNRRLQTLGAGSSLATGQVYAIGFQMDAPQFSGVMKEVKSLETTNPDYVKRKWK